jgi:hypothetical protein
MSISKNEIDLKGTKPNYLRTTKNLYSHFVEDKELFFSYQTLVAIDNLISVNDWSVTTGRHLTWINPNKDIRLDPEIFEKRARKILKAENLLTKRSDPLKTIGMVSALFSIMGEGEEDLRKTNNQRLRFYATQPGFIVPEDWDQLTLEHQKERLDKVDALALDKNA